MFELLDIKETTPGVWEVVTAEEKQTILYGSTQLIGSPQDLEQFRLHPGKHRIIEIRFRDIENRFIFDSSVSVLTTKPGPDFISHVVFLTATFNWRTQMKRSLGKSVETFDQRLGFRISVSKLF